MPNITQADAKKIAKKLSADYRNGSNHELALIYHNGLKIAQFGIRRDKAANHDYVANQIFMSRSDSISFGKCKISYDEWVERMRKKGVIRMALS